MRCRLWSATFAPMFLNFRLPCDTGARTSMTRCQMTVGLSACTEYSALLLHSQPTMQDVRSEGTWLKSLLDRKASKPNDLFSYRSFPPDSSLEHFPLPPFRQLQLGDMVQTRGQRVIAPFPLVCWNANFLCSCQRPHLQWPLVFVSSLWLP